MTPDVQWPLPTGQLKLLFSLQTLVYILFVKIADWMFIQHLITENV